MSFTIDKDHDRPLFSAQCTNCAHLWLMLRNGKPMCAAFPNGIPREILESRLDRRNPYPNDKGIRYEPATAAK